MKERPIIFSNPMVRAILEGRKSQTRRVVRPQPAYEPERGEDLLGVPGWYDLAEDPESGCFTRGDRLRGPCETGDRLYAREAWAPSFAWDDDSRGTGYVYRATNNGPDPLRWRSPIHMPRAAARIFLAVTDVRVERLQAITEDDACAEGVGPEFEMDAAAFVRGMALSASTYRLGFKHGWDRLNAKRGYPWASNPWVWVIEFRRIETS